MSANVEQHRMITGLGRPVMPFPFRIEDGTVIVDRAATDYVIETDGFEPEQIAQLFSKLNGDMSRQDIESYVRSVNPELLTFLDDLDRNHLLDDHAVPDAIPGINAYLEIEDYGNKFMHETLYRNVFWRHMRDADEAPPIQVFHGLAIENYHFLFRESYFDSPVLSYQGSTKARLLMNGFYCEELGHDELILKSLQSIGISREDLFRTMPLPETMALCNALTFWASADPLFFFTTLGILEGKDVKPGEQDSFLDACDRLKLDPLFVGPLRAHANINRDGHHGDLTRGIFRALPCIDRTAVRRLKAQTHLFIEMYDAFYTAVWDRYSTCKTLLRTIDRN